MPRPLIVKVTCGVEAPERCNQGFTVASLAAVSGVPVGLWLTGEATWFAVPGRAPRLDLPHATPVDELLDGVVAAGGAVTVCGQCAARRDLTEEHLRDGVAIAGAAVFVEQVTADGVQALVY